MSKRVTSVNPQVSHRRPNIAARYYTNGSELSIRARLAAMRKESISATDSLRVNSTELVKYVNQQHQADTSLSAAQKLTWQRVGRKAAAIKKRLDDFCTEMAAVTRDIELEYDKEQGNMLADMDQLALVNPTWINVNGLITNPNQVQMSKRGVGARKKAAAAAGEAENPVPAATPL